MDCASGLIPDTNGRVTKPKVFDAPPLYVRSNKAFRARIDRERGKSSAADCARELIEEALDARDRRRAGALDPEVMGDLARELIEEALAARAKASKS